MAFHCAVPWAGIPRGPELDNVVHVLFGIQDWRETYAPPCCAQHIGPRNICGTAPGHRPPANVASAEAPLVLLSSPCSYAATLPDLVHDLLPHVARGVVRSKSFCVVTRSGLRGLSPVCAFLRSDYRLDALHNALPNPVAFSVHAPPRGGLQRGDAAPKASNCSTGAPQLLRCPWRACSVANESVDIEIATQPALAKR